MTQYDGVHALHQDALHYPGGIAALARIIGRSAGVMHNKFSEATDHVQLGDREADALALAIRDRTGGTAYIEAKCATFGGVFVPVVSGAAGADDVMAAELAMHEQIGKLAHDYAEARSDAVVTDAEYQDLRVQANRVIKAVEVFMREVHSTVEPSPAPVEVLRRG